MLLGPSLPGGPSEFELLSNGPRGMTAAYLPLVTRRAQKSDYIEPPGECNVTLKSPYFQSPLANISKSRMTLSISALVSLCLVLLTWPITLQSRATLSGDVVAQSALTDPPRQSNGLTDVVQWDNYTLFVNNQRVLL